MKEKERSVIMPGRDLVEWVSDQLLLLYVINLASEIRRLHRVRIHKIMFLAELESWKRKIGGLDYRFIRHNVGPFSQELVGDINRFCKRSLIESYYGNKAYRILPEGKKLFEDAQTILARNKQILLPIMEKIQYIMEPPNINSRLPEIYSLPNPLKPQITIKDTELKDYLLSRETRPPNMKPFNITEEEAESFEIMLDPKLWNDYLLAEKSVREGPLINWRDNPLFS